MSDDLIMFTAHGRPVPQGSKRAFVNRGARFAKVVDVNDTELRSWRSVVADAARDVYDAEREGLLGGAIKLDVVFYFGRPKGHFGAGKNRAKLKTSAPMRHIVRPDADKLLRGICDALTGVIWRDDCQIDNMRARKCFGLPGAEIRITHETGDKS